MFSNNQKISGRQMQRLLLLDWAGRVVLLFPLLIQGGGSRSALITALIGVVLTLGLTAGLIQFSGRISGNYFSFVKKQAGSTIAWILYLIYGVYFLFQTMVMLRLCGEISKDYLLPETDIRLLLFLPLLAAFFLADGGLEVRGRISELLAGTVLVLLFLLLGNCLLKIRAEQILQKEYLDGYELAENAYLTMAGFGGIFMLPFVLPQTEKKSGWKRRLYAAVFINGLLLLLVYLSCFGIFGTSGMERLEWPVIALMSSINLQGVFLQRWDLLFVGLLLFSLFFAVGSGIYYMELLLYTLKQGGNRTEKTENGCSSWKRRKLEKKRRMLRVGISIAVYLMTAGIREWETMVKWYRQISLFGCIPLLIVLTLVIWGRSSATETKWRKAEDGWK